MIAMMADAAGGAGVKKLQRARFAAAVRLLSDVDEEGLKVIVKFLPAWVKVCVFSSFA